MSEQVKCSCGWASSPSVSGPFCKWVTRSFGEPPATLHVGGYPYKVRYCPTCGDRLNADGTVTPRVDEADLRWALTAIAFIGGLDCEKCVAQGSCLNWKQGTAGDDVTMFNCLQALLAHFGLAPAPEATDA